MRGSVGNANETGRVLIGLAFYVSLTAIFLCASLSSLFKLIAPPARGSLVTRQIYIGVGAVVSSRLVLMPRGKCIPPSRPFFFHFRRSNIY